MNLKRPPSKEHKIGAVRVSKELHKKFIEYRKITNLPVSEVIRESLRFFFGSNEK